jgi:chromosome segregation ATPase
MLDSSSSARRMRMADHFMEVVNVRFTTIDERIDSEIVAMQAHLSELRLAVHGRIEDLRGDVRDGLRSLTVRMDRLETRADKLEARMGRLETRVEGLEIRIGSLETEIGGLDARIGGLDGRISGLDGRMERLESGMALVLAAVQDIQQRLPAAG